MEAEIKLQYKNVKTAEAVAKAVSPDNLRAPEGMTVITLNIGRKVATRISVDGELSTFVATVDDLLFCVSTAEKTLQTLERLER